MTNSKVVTTKVLNAEDKTKFMFTNPNYGLFKYDPLVADLVKDKDLVNDSVYKIENLVYNKNENTHNSPATKEWTNSVYTYNKNYTKPLNSTLTVANKLITSYLNLTPLVNGKKSNVNTILEKRASLNKVIVSDAEVKHTNDKINLTVYVYNRKKKTLLKGISRLQKKSLARLTNASLMSRNASYLNNKFNNIFNYYVNNENVKNISNVEVNKDINMVNSTYTYTPKLTLLKKDINRNNTSGLKKRIKRLELINKKGILLINKVKSFKNEVIKAIISQNVKIEHSSSSPVLDVKSLNLNFANYELNYFSKYLRKMYVKEMLYIYYTKALLFNNNITKNWFLLGLKKSLSKLYNKKVELNIVNQKYFYFNSDIFIKAIATRLKDRNNSLLRELANALKDINLPTLTLGYKSKPVNVKSKGVNAYLSKEIFDSIKYKHIQGVRIEASGRLSKRLTAARSLSKIRNKGYLKNLDERFNNKSALMLRGSIKPNLQYTLLHSKTRNGAFGLKGWVNSD